MSVDFNNLVDDDGSNTVGTLIDKAELQALLMGTGSVTSTLTGAQNNWAPGLAGHTFITWSGASDATFSGITGGVAGQIAMVRNLGTKVAFFLHLSGLSSAANQFRNSATSAATPVGPGGYITYRHNGTNWLLMGHEQGAWITPTYAGGDYTASTGTWTVDSGDVARCVYRLSGNTLSVAMSLLTTSVSATPVALRRIIPGGYTAATPAVDINTTIWAANAGGAQAVATIVPSSTLLVIGRDPAFTAWGTATNSTAISVFVSFDVT